MIFAGDVIIKTAIEMGLDDVRKNPWLIDDILSQMVDHEALRSKYGQKEIDACKKWLAENKIEIYMKDRNDKDQMPCITIGLGSSTEMPEEKTMGDLSTEVIELIPSKIGKPIPYVLKPFVPVSYDPEEGLVELPSDSPNSSVAEGMILVNPDTGAGYVVRGRAAGNKLQIDPGIEIAAARLAVVPQFQIYRARREHSWFHETYSIGCHVHGDPAALLWLHAIVIHILLRYREGLLEARGFTESLIASSDLVPNNDWGQPGGENVRSRYVTLSGKVEHSWLKTPRRVIENVQLANCNEENGFSGGIKIISQDAPEFLDNEDQPWLTIDE